MRIVIDLQSCQNSSRFRGIGRYALAITKALITEGRKHDFRIFLTDAYPETIGEVRRAFDGLLPQDHIVVCSLIERTTAADPNNAWRNRAAELIRREFIARLEPDLLFVPALFEGLWDNAVIGLEQCPFPTALTLHDLIPLEDLQLYLPKQQDRDAYFRKLRDLRRADLLVCISAFVAEEAANVIGVDPARILTILNGVNPEFRRPKAGTVDRADLMKRMGISRPFIFNTSPLEHRKNLHGLISGFASMSPAVREGHQIVIAGGMDAHARKHLAELVRGEGLPEDSLILTGRVSDADLIALYSECALFSFPALSEGFGLPPLEAMACGAPVIVSTATALPEVVDRADLLVDPADPAAIGAGMERILTDPKLQAELRTYGPKRAAKFSWSKAAKAMLKAFETLEGKPAPAPIAAGRSHIALVCPTLDWDSTLAGRVAGLAAQLADLFEVTLVCPESERRDAWARAHAEVRDFEWLEWNAPRFDAILYATDWSADDRLAALIANLPGILVLLDGMDGEAKAEIPQRDLYAYGGLGALTDAAAGRIDADRIAAMAGESLVHAARMTLREGDDGLPLLPLLNSERAGAALREEIGVPAEAALVIAIVGDERTSADLTKRFRSAALAGAHLLICATEASETDEEGHGAIHLASNVHRLRATCAARYRGLLSAADLALAASDLLPPLRARIMADAKALGLTALLDVDQKDSLAAEIATALTPRMSAEVRPRPVALSVANRDLSVWAARVSEAVSQSSARALSLLAAVDRALPGSVRGQTPDADDLAQVATAIATNAAFEREPACFVDLTAYVASGRRLDPAANAHLRALFRRGGRRINGIVQNGADFTIANQRVGQLLGLRDFELADEVFLPRPGDRIIGLDLFESFQPGSFDAMRAAHNRGAALLYLADSQIALQGGREEALADFLLKWAEIAEAGTTGTISALPGAPSGGAVDARLAALARAAAEGNLPLQILTSGAPIGLELDPTDAPGAVETAWAALSAAPRTPGSVLNDDTGFAVMGHLIGSYSLAMINRNVARTLEQWRPGHVRFLPFETIPISHTDGVPAREKALMGELAARTAPKGDEIVISQHWPIMPPSEPARLALSLFPWEESCVPDAIVETLNGGFDAILAPSQSVADALAVSGIRLPVAAIGQPTELEPFRALADKRVARKRIRRFLHVSSCFERKGIDLLLRAWARAFTADDKVELVIKTFPNPHNQIEARVADLQAGYPRLAPIQIVNREAEREEIAAFYAAADAMVLPSRGEGYNLPALEAMAAGLPLIVTGHGGHRDFCGPDQARLIAYHFTPSSSHVAADHSLWAEPDLDDLVQALREFNDPAQAKAIETRRLNALAAAATEGDRSAWIRRFQGVVTSLLAGTDRSAPRIGWISTWRVTCGIAQYSAHLIERMSPAVQQRMKIICDRRTGPDQGEISHVSTWTVMQGDAGDIVTGVRESDVEAVVIQHQDGLVPWEQLGWIGHDRAMHGLVTVAILHNVRTLSWKVSAEELPMVVSGLANMTRVLVHTRDDLNRLRELGLDRNIGLFPHGAVAPEGSPWPRRIRSGDAPIIGCHGFFLRHKGIDKLIRAAAILRREWPGLKLRLVNARFPNPEHEGAVGECEALARELGIEDAIEWHLDFLPTDKIEQLLAGCDLIVLPYDDSDDSVSGAVRTALASMVPLVATRVKIFGDLGDAIGWADNNDPEVLATTIASLLRSPEKRREIQAGMHAWLTAHDWQRLATTLENMLHGLVQQKRLGWLTRNAR